MPMLLLDLALAILLPYRFSRCLLESLLRLGGLLQPALLVQRYPDLTSNLLSLFQKPLHLCSCAKCKLDSTKVLDCQ